MAIQKTPERVTDGARPEEGKSSDLVEIAKRSGDLSQHYGKFWGGLLLLSMVNAASGRRPFLWGGLLGLGLTTLGVTLKYAVAAMVR